MWSALLELLALALLISADSGTPDAPSCPDGEDCADPSPLEPWSLPAGSTKRILLPAAVSGGTFEATVESLGSSAAIFRVSPFLRSAEVDALISNSKKHLQPSDASVAVWRQSSYINWPGGKGHLAARVQTLLGFKESEVSVWQLQCYEKGGFYHPHYDSSRLDQLNATLPPDFPGGPGTYPNAARYATLVVYLSDGGADFGGETYFPFDGLARERVGWDLGHAVSPADNVSALQETAQMWAEHCLEQRRGTFVRPKKGDAILFYNHLTTPDGRVGELDSLSFHASCPVRRGKKCMMNMWISVPPIQFGYPTSRHCTRGDDGTSQCRPVPAERAKMLRDEFMSYMLSEGEDRDWSDLARTSGFSQLSRKRPGSKPSAPDEL